LLDFQRLSNFKKNILALVFCYSRRKEPSPFIKPAEIQASFIPGFTTNPGSLKSRNCIHGRRLLVNFCQEHSIRYKICGKLVIAANNSECALLENLHDRGKANGLRGLRLLGRDEATQIEPNVLAVRALLVTETGIIDFTEVCNKLSTLIKEKGGQIALQQEFEGIHKEGDEFLIKTPKDEFRARYVVNCAGLHSDRVAKRCGIIPKARIIGFRGEYYELKNEFCGLVRNLIYPVPDPRYPFLGVHFTRMINDGVECGPNAVLALKREGYSKYSFNLTDSSDILTYSGFWKMAAQHWKMGFSEMIRSQSKTLFVRSLKKLIPCIEPKHIVPGGAGVRAQAVTQEGALLDDFCIEKSDRAIHVLNAPSPAATSCLSIGEQIAGMV
jgi:L-2-hydroxyglutarate oxidase